MVTSYEKTDLITFETQFCHLARFTRKIILTILKIDFATWHVLQEKYFKWFEKSIFLIGTFYEKNYFETARPVLDMFFDVYYLHGVLDASWCRMSYRQWRIRKPSLTGLSRV